MHHTYHDEQDLDLRHKIIDLQRDLQWDWKAWQYARVRPADGLTHPAVSAMQRNITDTIARIKELSAIRTRRRKECQ